MHLDQVRAGAAPDDYQVPARFFERSYLTQDLLGAAAEVVEPAGWRRQITDLAGAGPMARPCRTACRPCGQVAGSHQS